MRMERRDAVEPKGQQQTLTGTLLAALQCRVATSTHETRHATVPLPSPTNVRPKTQPAGKYPIWKHNTHDSAIISFL